MGPRVDDTVRAGHVRLRQENGATPGRRRRFRCVNHRCRAPMPLGDPGLFCPACREAAGPVGATA